MSNNPVEALVLKKKDRFVGALKNTPVGFDPFLGALLGDCLKNPKLAEAAQQNPESLLDCLMVCANAGLLPGAAHGLFYLIPRWNGRKRINEVTCIVGYRGLCDVAYRHPRVHSVEAHLIYKDEPFEWHPGSGHFVHEYRMDIERTDDKIIGAYAKALLTAPKSQQVVEIPVIHVMTRTELDDTMERSQSYQAALKYGKTNSPYHTDKGAMFRKAPLRRLINSGSVPRLNILIEVMAMDQENLDLQERIAMEEPETLKELPPSRSIEVAERLGIKVTKPGDELEVSEKTTTTEDGVERPLYGDIKTDD
jgi:phage RecT family recombinase